MLPTTLPNSSKRTGPRNVFGTFASLSAFMNTGLSSILPSIALSACSSTSPHR